MSDVAFLVSIVWFGAALALFVGVACCWYTLDGPRVRSRSYRMCVIKEHAIGCALIVVSAGLATAWLVQ